jgi:hypothetical protein
MNSGIDLAAISARSAYFREVMYGDRTDEVWLDPHTRHKAVDELCDLVDVLREQHAAMKSGAVWTSSAADDGLRPDDYRKAVRGEGEDEFLSLGYQWEDKPHRLVFDLCDRVDMLVALVSALESPVTNRPACEEASRLSREKYIPCGLPASSLIWSGKDKRAYAMCECCADHSVRNRGMVEIARRTGRGREGIHVKEM